MCVQGVKLHLLESLKNSEDSLPLVSAYGPWSCFFTHLPSSLVFPDHLQTSDTQTECLLLLTHVLGLGEEKTLLAPSSNMAAVLYNCSKHVIVGPIKIVRFPQNNTY